MGKIIICYINREEKREWKKFNSENEFIIKMYNLDFNIDYVFINDKRIEVETVQMLLSKLIKKEAIDIRMAVEEEGSITVEYKNYSHLEYLIKNIVGGEIDFSIESENEIDFYLRD